MTLNEFVSLNGSGAMFKVVDATAAGYMNTNKYLAYADRNVVGKLYGKKTVAGYDAIGKNKIAVYIK